MPIQLFDTLSRTYKTLAPADGETFRFYCCGPTVYGAAHIGNFRTFVLQDILRRSLEADGWPTCHIRNITDVDDKTIRESQEEQKSLKEFTDFWRERFHQDCATLNLLSPHIEPSAVAHVNRQIELIRKLVENGHAYVENGSVYFSIQSFAGYGRLSHLAERELTTNRDESAHQHHDQDEYERETAADFALWKARKPEDGPNYWESPWGQGRPGWHIECSAMSMQYLGATLDLHSGGIDLIFPHHENEIAQSEAVTGKPFVNHWFHVAHLLVEDNKMSKSLGNLLTLDEITRKGFSGQEIRYVLLEGHYRHPLNFTWDSLKAARKALQRMARFDEALRSAAKIDKEATGCPDNKRLAGINHSFEKAWNALENDLNTPEALGQIFVALKRLQREIENGSLSSAQARNEWLGWRRMLFALGIQPERSREAPKPPQEVVEMADARWDAKKKKDFDTADQLRESIRAKGWQVKDRPDHYELAPADE